MDNTLQQNIYKYREPWRNQYIFTVYVFKVGAVLLIFQWYKYVSRSCQYVIL